MQFLKSILFGALILLFSATVVAQGHRGERRGFDLEKMTEQLDLTPEQATKLKTIHEEQRAAFAKLAEGLPEGERPDREAMRSAMKDSRAKMMDVLTPEQQEKLKAERPERRRRGGKDGEAKPKMNEDLRAEMRTYRSETITPKFVEVRTAFDKNLNATERAQISTLREAVRAELGERGLKQMTSRGAKTGHKGARKGQRAIAEKDCAPSSEAKCEPGCEPGNESTSKATGSREGHRSEMRAFMQKHKTEVQAVRDIVKAHQPELAAVRTELDAAKVQWKKDGDAIRAKHLSAEDLARYKARSEKRQAKRTEHAGKGRRGGESQGDNDSGFSRANRGAFTFLLLDPANMEAEGFEEIASEKLSVYPNPATDQTTIKFEVRTSGPVRVELVDASGKVLRTVLKGERNADTYEVPVTFPSSMGKTGMIRVTDAQGVRTVQVTRG